MNRGQDGDHLYLRGGGSLDPSAASCVAPASSPSARADADAHPRLLDAFCGAGGVTRGYQSAGFHVTGIDNRPQPHYCGDVFVLGDALELLADREFVAQFDAIHASPPCQAYTTMRVMPNAGIHPELVEPTRTRLQETGLPWVMENVPGAPLNSGPPSLFTNTSGVVLCGTMFGLDNGDYELRRHRQFESNVPLYQPACRHRLPVVGFYGDHARTRQRTVDGNRDRGGDIVGNARKMPLVRDLLGIDWMVWDEATQAIPPAYTEHIGHQLMLHVRCAA